MSRIAKKGITLPPKTEITVASGIITVKGGKGTLTRVLPEELELKVEEGGLIMVLNKVENPNKSSWGTLTSHLVNMVTGVSTGFIKKLILEGVGYKAEVKGKDLVMALGFSHPVKVTIPEGITTTVEKGVVSISGIDKDKVGQFAAYIRDLKKPEPYKGKGFRYDTEVIRRKQGKKSV